MNMTEHILTLDEIKDVSMEEIIRRILTQRDTLTIQISDEEQISIQLKPKLKPLLLLEGKIPPGWKEAIYG